MPNFVYAYRVLPAGADRPAAEVEAEARAAVEARLAGEPVRWAGLLADDAGQAGTPLLRRPAGGRLSGLLARGDVVFFTGLDAFADTADAARVVTVWADRGVRVVVAEVAGELLDTDRPSGRLLVSHLTAFVRHEQDRRGQERRQVAERLKQEGRPNSGRPPYGFRVVGRAKGRKRLVRLRPGEGVRAWAATFISWRDEHGCSWHTIWQHLLANKALRDGGRQEWSTAAIRRCYRMEKVLRQQEVTEATCVEVGVGLGAATLPQRDPQPGTSRPVTTTPSSCPSST